MMMLRSRLARTLSTQPLGRTLSTNPSWPLAGKTIVVAGAGNPPAEGHGIGAMTSIVLARQGANVVSVSNEALNCQTVTDAIVAEGLEGIAHVADCTKGGDVEGLVAATVAKYGRCDAVINAGIHSALPMGFGKMTEEAWAKGIDLRRAVEEVIERVEEFAVGRRGARLLADRAAGDRRADGLRRLRLRAVHDLDDLVGGLRGGRVSRADVG